MEYNWNDIGKRIKYERKRTINPDTKKAFTQDEFCKKLGICRNRLSALENGTVGKDGSQPRLHLDTMLNMCKLFNCELGYLLCEYDTKRREIAEVQEMIGLSEEAICMLKELCELQTFDHVLEMVSCFITDCSSDRLNTVCTIAGHSESIEKAEWERDHIHHSDFEYEKQKGADLYIIQNAFMDFINRYIDNIRKERKEQWQTFQSAATATE